MIDWFLSHAPHIAAALGAVGLHGASLLYAAAAGRLQASHKGRGLDADAANLLKVASAITAVGWLLAVVAT
jgi:hypothetical protein